jgi:DNA-binding NtrC family response regulator
MVAGTAQARERSGTRILAVDDEPALLQLLEKYLKRLGYQVEACSGAREALERFAARPHHYTLLLVDLNMPDIDARVRVLLCSGYPFDPHMLPEPMRDRVRFLQKPFAPKMLAQAIEELLGSESAHDSP